MLVVPVAGDKVKLLGLDAELRVTTYTSLKSEPAVYLSTKLEDGSRAAYFSDIVAINGTPVEYEGESKLLRALGPLKRKFNLPQPDDKVTVKLIQTSFKQESSVITVEELRLHSRNVPSKALVLKADGSSFYLNDIIDIDRSVGFEKFSRAAFLNYYMDYLPFKA